MRTTNLGWFFGIFLLLRIHELWGQDPSFTQYNQLPLYLNPATTGNIEGSYRFSFIHRNQPLGLFSQPHITLASSFDLRIPLTIDGKTLNDAASAGVFFMQDRSDAAGWNAQSVYLSGAFHKTLNPKIKQQVSAGFQVGINQRSVGYSALAFEDQFDGVKAYSRSSAEDFPTNNFAFGDMAAGIQYSFLNPSGLGAALGASIAHFHRPNQSFYQDSPLFLAFNTDRPLAIRYALHASAVIPFSSQFLIQPRIMGSKQGPHLAALGGLYLITQFPNTLSTAMHLGITGRTIMANLKTVQLESAILVLGLEINNLLIGLSYDAGLTSLFKAVPGRRNAIELSFSYTGKYNNDKFYCPKF